MEMNSTVRSLHRPRVFIDANILISGLFFKGPESIVLRLGILGLIDIVTCEFVVEEVREVIRRKFPEAENKFDNLLEIITVLKTKKNGKARRLIRDKKDIPVLATAIEYRPDYFITGDEDFHTSEIKKLLNVVRTQDFLDSLSDLKGK